MIQLRNESDVELMAVLSQLTALQWNNDPIKPGETHILSVSRLWFTLSVNGFDAKRRPTQIGVAARLSFITSATLMSGFVFSPVAFVLAGGASRATTGCSGKARKTLPWNVGDSYKMVGCRKDFCFGDGRTYVIKGIAHQDGLYQLYIHSVEYQNGKVKTFPAPKLRTKGAPVKQDEIASCFHDGSVAMVPAEEEQAPDLLLPPLVEEQLAEDDATKRKEQVLETPSFQAVPLR